MSLIFGLFGALWFLGVVANGASILFLAADNGTLSGMNELHYISSAVFEKHSVEGFVYCQSVITGKLATSAGYQDAILATTGIGSVAAALCTDEVLDRYSPWANFFIGTSGASPVVGGFDPSKPEGCQVLKNVTPVAIGSVCVTSQALSLSCGVCVSSTPEASSECRRPNCSLHNDSAYFGKCTQRVPARLEADVRSAARSLQLPHISDKALLRLMEAWWGQQEAIVGAGVPVVPRVFEKCVEADAHQIWVGAPLDYLCRQYSARLLGSDALHVPCVSAMEATGFLRVLSHRPPIPTVIVRGVSNMDMYPLRTDGQRWTQNTRFVEPDEYVSGVKAGYRFAVFTSNAVVLHYLGAAPPP